MQFRAPLATSILVVLGAQSSVSTASAEPAGPSLGPSPAAVEEARRALEAGDSAASIALLVPPPLAGSGTCVMAAALLAEEERPRAFLYLQRCHAFAPDPELRRQITTLRQRLREDDLAPVSLALRPGDATARLSEGFGDDLLLANDELWLGPGKYQLVVSAKGYEEAAFAVEVESTDRMLVPISLNKVRAQAVTEIDLGEDSGAELGQTATTADPRPKKFKTLLADRYRRAPDPKPISHDSGDTHGPWPLITAATGLAGLGLGVVAQLQDRNGLAITGYAAGATLGGIAAYLLFRADGNDKADTAAGVSLNEGGGILSVTGRW